MIRFLAFLIALLFAAPALAEPALDATTHPYIKLVTTAKAVYRVGEPGSVVLTLRNPGGSSFSGSVVTTIYLNGNVVGATTTPVTIAAGATPVVSVPFTITNAGDRGYRVDVVVLDGLSAIMDGAQGSIDVQASTFAATFPRQCWLSHYPAGLDATYMANSAVAWKCNTWQFYDAYYRPELAPPAGLAQWPALNNDVVVRATVQSLITAARARSMPSLFFQATGEAYSNFEQQAVKPKLEWGSFDTACGLTKSCTSANLNQSPPAPSPWTSFGWQADHLDFFDPCNAAWQQFLIDKSIRPMIGQFGFDGWQADTVGAPSTNNGLTYNYQGKLIDTKACLGDFTTGANTRLGKPTILNNVSGWGLVDTALAGAQPYVYRETWNFDTQFYPGLNGIVNGPFALRQYTTRALVQPAYLQRNLSSRCSAGTQTTGCTVNGNSALLATAMFAISGSTLMNHQDDKCIMTDVYVPGYALPCSPAVQSQILTYKNFEVSYQHMLRAGVTDGTEPCNITSGATGGTSGAAGQVYVLGKNKAGFQICHLLNLTGVSSNDWTDLEGTKETPTSRANVGMKIYYYGNTVVSGTNKLWWASPDVANGAAQALSYTTGSDGSGQFVTFTLPSLSYWDMIVLETSTTGTNLAIDARQPIRGNWYADASAGVSPASAYVSAACCKRYAAYRKVEFGGIAASTVNIIYTAAKASAVTLRLDGRDGAIIGNCALAPGANATTTCPVTPTTGLHDVYVEFNQPINLFGFFFS